MLAYWSVVDDSKQKLQPKCSRFAKIPKILPKFSNKILQSELWDYNPHKSSYFTDAHNMGFWSHFLLAPSPPVETYQCSLTNFDYAP